MNIMITNVSTIYLPKISSSQYELNDEPDLKTDGVITNEAPIKLLMQKLARKNEKLDQIIFIVTTYSIIMIFRFIIEHTLICSFYRI